MEFLGGGFIHIFHVHPELWGRWTQLDGRIFFRWVGEKPPSRFWVARTRLPRRALSLSWQPCWRTPRECFASERTPRLETPETPRPDLYITQKTSMELKELVVSRCFSFFQAGIFWFHVSFFGGVALRMWCFRASKNESQLNRSMVWPSVKLNYW